MSSRQHNGGEKDGVSGATGQASSRGAALEVPVYGMDCQACAGNLETALGGIPGVVSVKADVASCRVSITSDGTDLDRARLEEKVEDLGFSLRPPEEEPSALRRNWKKLSAFGLIAAAVIAGGVFAFEWSQAHFVEGGRLTDLNSVFSSVTFLAIGLAFLFGVIIAFSPFTFAIAPAVMGYVASARHTSRTAPARLSAAFVAGIVTSDVMVGAFFGAIGEAAISFFSNNLPLWYGIITLILLGLALIVLRVWRIEIPMFKPRLHEARSARGAYFMGFPFGLIACPGCTPLLLPVALGAAATGNALWGAVLMGAFGLGRGVPLGVLGTSTGAFQRARGFTRYVPWVEKTVGFLLLAGAAFFAREWFRVSDVLLF